MVNIKERDKLVEYYKSIDWTKKALLIRADNRDICAVIIDGEVEIRNNTFRIDMQRHSKVYWLYGGKLAEETIFSAWRYLLDYDLELVDIEEMRNRLLLKKLEES